MPLALIVFFAQLFYTVGDVMRKVILGKFGLTWKITGAPTFWIAFVLSTVGFLIQLYAFSRYELSRTVIFLGTFAVIMSTVVGVLYLKEKLNIYTYIGLGFAVMAIIFTHIETTK
jgi:drug/metabolite transporter (DMT)-like permease